VEGERARSSVGASSSSAAAAAESSEPRVHPLFNVAVEDAEAVRLSRSLRDIQLPALEVDVGTESNPLDLLVVGCGPAGLAVAELAGKRGLRVAVVDPDPLRMWPANYGVWVDEFEAMGLADCFDKTWEKARVCMTEEENERTGGVVLNRPYGRVNRAALKRRLLELSSQNGVMFAAGLVGGGEGDVVHAPGHSTVRCKGLPGGRTELVARQVLDATGHSRRLVEFAEDFTPGYQAAYGAMLRVADNGHAFDPDEMFFMDWRDEHLEGDDKRGNAEEPTFLYTMPFSRTKLFVEETSLVARPGVPFDELKDRLVKRLAYLGVKVEAFEEEEFCLIPMGGVLPKMPQRVLGIGGTAGMVHPSTGFMIARTLKSAPTLVDAIVGGMEAQREAGGAYDADEVSRRVWAQVWPEEEQRQRTFMVFGMEILLNMDVDATRRFFAGFFSLQDKQWGGFLSWRLSAVSLIGFGLSLFAESSWRARLEIIVKALPFLPTFVSNFLGAKNAFESEPFGGIVSRESVPKLRGSPPDPQAIYADGIKVEERVAN